MSKLNITEGEWEVRNILGYPRAHDRPKIVSNDFLICESGGGNHEEVEANMKAIAAAVNNTYKKGINPEAYEEVVKRLKDAYEAIDSLPDEALGVKAVPDEVGDPEPQPIKWEIMYRIQEALKKARIDE